MNSKQWRQLNERVSREFKAYQTARQQGLKIANAKRFCELAVDALTIAGVLDRTVNQKKYPPIFEYKNDLDGKVLKLGPAVVILSDLPDPNDISDADCSIFYFELLRGAIDSKAPAELLFLAFNYANQLLNRFQNHRYFTDGSKIEALEADLRKRMMARDCAESVVHGDSEEHPLVTMYRQSLRRVADTYMRTGNYAGSVGSLIREFDRKYQKIEGVSELARYEVLFWAHYYNRLLGVLPSDEFPDGFQKVKRQLKDWQIQAINEFENPGIEGVELRNMSIRPTEGHIPREAKTTIVVSLPTSLPEGVFQVDDCEIRIVPLSDPFSDPNFLFLHRQPIIMGGMPLAVLSPAIANESGATLVEVSLPKPFFPGIELNKHRQVEETHREDYKQLHGQDFDPYLAKAAEVLLSVWQNGGPSRKEIISSLKKADSYTVAYFSPDREQTYLFFQPLIKLSTFVAARDLFLSRFKKAAAHGHGSKNLKKYLFKETSLDAKGLQRFSKDVIREFISVPSERGEWWKTVWAEGSNYKKVRLEPNVARDIYNVIAPWFKVRGLILDREVSAAGGDIDMLAASPSGTQFHRCGIEIKFAHHSKIVHGISGQLPDYLDDLEAEVGLFVTLWCKGETFPSPSKYEDISALEKELFDNIPHEKCIDVVTVDASFRQPPSKRH